MFERSRAKFGLTRNPCVEMRLRFLQGNSIRADRGGAGTILAEDVVARFPPGPFASLLTLPPRRVGSDSKAERRLIVQDKRDVGV